MSYNGSGTFQINTTGQPVVAGTVISSTAFNALTADLATGLSTAITKDGQTTTTARIPFAAGISSTLVTDSSSVSTGSIITAGGVGVAKALYVGTTANIAGASTFTGAIAVDSVTDSSSTITGSIQTDGGLGVAKAVFIGTTLNVASTTTLTGVATLTANPVLSAGTANGVTYLNGSKSLTSGTGLVFDGTNLGIGTSSPANKLDVLGSSYVVGRFLRNGTTTASGGVQVGNNSQVFTMYGDSTGLSFENTTSSTTPLVLTAAGNVLVGVTSANANGGILQLKSGITFPATQVAATDANTLDDYEEGTWTPAGGSLTNNTTATYTKVGRLVHANFDVTFPGGGAATQGNITGLPFTILTPGGGGSIGFTGYITPITLNIERSVTYFYFVTFAGVGVTYANLNGVRIIGSLVYSV